MTQTRGQSPSGRSLSSIQGVNQMMFNQQQSILGYQQQYLQMLGGTMDSNESALMLSAKTLSPSDGNTASGNSERRFHQFAS